MCQTRTRARIHTNTHTHAQHTQTQPPEVCDTGGNTAACDSDCTVPACGDGVFNPFAEECDGVNCTAACLRCGNGLLDPGEACDYAMAGETECTTACAIATDPPEDVGNDGNGDAVENATGADDDGATRCVVNAVHFPFA